MKVDVGSAGPSLCSEIPNDNPALSAGVRWVCLDTTGLAVAMRERAIEVEPVIESESLPLPPLESAIVLVEAYAEDDEDDEDDEPIVVEELPPLDDALLVVEGAGLNISSAITIVPPPSGDPWTMFVSALADVAIGAGSPHAASLVSALLLHASAESLPQEMVPALADANVVRQGAVTRAFVTKLEAWRGILQGTSDDYSACGEAMLDDWAADLLARLLGGVSRATALKRELRERGVAAFGLAA